MCAAFIVLSAWLTVPFTVSFTLQTLAIFVISAVFNLRVSLGSVCLYVALGIFGLPVFSGFSSGVSAIAGPTGGFVIGFLFIPIIIFCFKAKNKPLLALSMLASLLFCYFVGTLWYMLIYSGDASLGIWGAPTVCVIPFIIPDLAKIAIAVFISARLKNIIHHGAPRRKQ
jgi:biotin transport system substrate-specific component